MYIYTSTDTSVIASTSRKRQRIDLEGNVCTYICKKSCSIRYFNRLKIVLLYSWLTLTSRFLTSVFVNFEPRIKTHSSESRGQEEAGLRDEPVSYLQVAPL